MRDIEKAILDYRNKQVNRDRNALFAFDRLELILVQKLKDQDRPDDKEGTLPTSREKGILRNVLNNYSNEAMFNTPNGKVLVIYKNLLKMKHLTKWLFKE